MTAQTQSQSLSQSQSRPAIYRSQRVRASDFDTDWFKSRAREMNLEVGRYHRKIWEDCVIAQTFIDHVLNPAVDRWQHTSKKPKLRALGFGCGKEPIPKWLAENKVSVIATDAPGINPAWDDTNQRAHNLADLGLDSDNKLVEFREVDMNAIPDDLLRGEFDFTWSCGSFEHIGGIDQSLEFFRDQMRCLKPGGIACHTTEFNFQSSKGFGGDDPTIESQNLVLFRRRDLAMLAGRLWVQGDTLWLPDLNTKSAETDTNEVHDRLQLIDNYIDNQPYTAPYHLNIEIGGYVTTSVVLIATRGERV